MTFMHPFTEKSLILRNIIYFILNIFCKNILCHNIILKRCFTCTIHVDVFKDLRILEKFGKNFSKKLFFNKH